jgi:predicted enzyme related to lactoylglutathione lyase
MRPKLNGIAFILHVQDVLRTQRFYTEHLGISFTRNPEADGSVWLLAKVGNETEMLVFPGDPAPGNTPGIVFGLAEGGIETIVAGLAAADAEIVSPVAVAPGGWSADFKDPDGHTMSLFQDGSLPKTLATSN